MLVLGIDPSLSSTGWALLKFDKKKKEQLKAVAKPTLLDINNEYKPELVNYGVITTSNKDRLCNRVFQQREEMKKIILNYDPEILVSEDQYGHLNIKTLKNLSHVRGQHMAIAAQMKKPFVLYTPSEIKKIATGKGNAKKKQVIDSINKYYNLELDNDNIADAIAVALSYIFKPDKGTYI